MTAEEIGAASDIPGWVIEEKDRAVWQAAPHIAHRLGATGAFALELDYVSCGTPVAMRVCRDLLIAEPDVGSVLAVAA